MKICWDNLEKLRYNKKTGKWYTKNKTPYILKFCPVCNGEFLGKKKNIYCSKSCAMSYRRKGQKLSEEQKRKISNSHKNKKLSEETKEKMKMTRLKRLKFKIKQDYVKNNIPTYDTYSHQIDWVDECRRNTDDPNILEVKCTYCGRWFVPKLWEVKRRIQALKSQTRGEHRLYCSKSCKKECPIYGKQPSWIEREDAIRAGRLNWIELNREVQPELRQLVFERDDYTCQKCGNMEHLHCHHILPASIEPIESADVDNCITYCKECHRKAHDQDGCKYGQLRMCA